MRSGSSLMLFLCRMRRATKPVRPTLLHISCSNTTTLVRISFQRVPLFPYRATFLSHLYFPTAAASREFSSRPRRPSEYCFKAKQLLPSCSTTQTQLGLHLAFGSLVSGVPSTSSAPKSASTSLRQLIGKRKPPGPPPGPPPPLLSDDEDDEPHYKPKRREKRRIRFNDDSTRDPEEPEKDSRTMYKQQAKMLVAAALQSDQMPAPPAYEECKHCASRSP